MPTALALVALILAAIDELQAQGRALTSWAVILIAIALLWGRLG
jgi:drug/metabolite transporter superfamily protein YnfA